MENTETATKATKRFQITAGAETFEANTPKQYLKKVAELKEANTPCIVILDTKTGYRVTHKKEPYQQNYRIRGAK